MSIENSGLSCSYYEVHVKAPHLFHKGKQDYIAECGEIADALNLTTSESNIFKEIWRGATARLGKEKEGNSIIRSAEKIKFFADRIHYKAKFYEENK